MLQRIFLAIATLLLLATPAHAQRLPRKPIEITEITGTVRRNSLTRNLRVGDRLGQGAIVFSRWNGQAWLQLDHDQCLIVLTKNSRLTVAQLTGKNNAAQTLLLLHSGAAYPGCRTFTSRFSWFRLADLKQARVVEHRGTQFGVSLTDTGDMVVAVENGLAIATSEGVTVGIPPLMVSRVEEGQPPAPPVPVDMELKLEGLKVRQTGTWSFIEAKIDPNNSLEVNGATAYPDKSGKVSLRVHSIQRRGNAGRGLRIVVVNPLGMRRTIRSEHLQ